MSSMRDLINIILQERVLGVSQRGTKYLVNPRYAEIMGIINAKDGDRYAFGGIHPNEVRGWIIGGNLYVWNAYNDIHKFAREELFKEFGIGPDEYTGRSLVIQLKQDGSLGVLLGGIRRGYFVSVGEDTINKFARLKAAITPPVTVNEGKVLWYSRVSGFMMVENPTLGQAKTLITRSIRHHESGYVRGIMVEGSRVLAWDGWSATHDDVRERMLQKYPSNSSLLTTFEGSPENGDLGIVQSGDYDDDFGTNPYVNNIRTAIQS